MSRHDGLLVSRIKHGIILIDIKLKNVYRPIFNKRFIKCNMKHSLPMHLIRELRQSMFRWIDESDLHEICLINFYNSKLKKLYSLILYKRTSKWK